MTTTLDGQREDDVSVKLSAREQRCPSCVECITLCVGEASCTCVREALRLGGDDTVGGV